MGEFSGTVLVFEQKSHFLELESDGAERAGKCEGQCCEKRDNAVSQ